MNGLLTNNILYYKALEKSQTTFNIKPWIRYSLLLLMYTYENLQSSDILL